MVGTEYRFALARTVVVPGPRSIVLVSHEHDLAPRLYAAGSPVWRAADAAAGRRRQAGEAHVHAVVGRYSMVCTISDHAALGMTARLTVRKPR